MKKDNLISLSVFKNEFFPLYQDLFISEFGFYIQKNRITDFYAVIIKHLKNSAFEDFDSFFHHLRKKLLGKPLLNRIINDITIGETYFFRNSSHFDLLKSHVLPDLIARKKKQNDYTLKIWSAGCSTGEEVYSLAIAVLEALPNKNIWDVKVVGSDINSNSIDVAEQGIYYGNRPRRHIIDADHKKYFIIKENSVTANEELRSVTQFSRHNLIHDKVPVSNPDIIFCRNVTIYFNKETTSQVIHKFYNSLKDKGFLFLGHSETIWKICDKFKVLDFPKGFIYQKDKSITKIKESTEEPHAVIPNFNFNKLNSKPVITSSSKEKITEESGIKYAATNTEQNYEKLMKIDVLFHDGLTFFEKKEHTQALKCFDQVLKLDANYIIVYFAKANLYSNEGKYKEALIALDKLLMPGSLFLEAYYLKAVLQMKLHKYQQSIETFKKIIYIDQSFALAYFHLANIYKELDDKGQEMLNWKNLKRTCHSLKKTSIVYLSDNLTYGTLEMLADKSIEGA